MEGEGGSEWSKELGGIDLLGVDDVQLLDVDQLMQDVEHAGEKSTDVAHVGEKYGEKEDVNEDVPHSVENEAEKEEVAHTGENVAAAHDPEMTLLLIVFGLRLLFNTKSGVCGWMPVMYKGESVAIVSLWIVKWLFSGPFTRNGTRYIVDFFEDVQNFFKTKFAKTAVDWCGSKFYDSVMQTPFKPFPIALPSLNSSKFFVAPLGGWMEVVLKPKLDFAGVSLDLDISRVPAEFGQ